jgi:4-hydroxy-4-methyl-2-oxoglutarate aldolase
MNESKPTGKRPDDVPGLMHLGKLISEREEVPAVDFPVPTEEIIARYEKLYTGAVSDVLREQGLLFQALPPGLQCLRPERTVAGFAFTVKSAPNVMIRGEMDIRTRMLDELRPGGFVVWDSTDDVSATLWGGVMTAAATRAGVRAACISGGIRDTHQILQKDFPVFYKHRSPKR